MKLVIEHSTAGNMSFHSNLFKMQTDQLSFERFEELFDGEDEELPNEPTFDNEWRRCENVFLHTDEAAVFVVVVDVTSFIDRASHVLKFLVSYEIKFESITAKMMMDAGEIDVEPKMLYGVESQINGVSEVYKDLLAITSTSKMVQLLVKFTKPPKLKLQEFLQQSMKFVQLTNDNDETQATNTDFAMTLDTDRMEIDHDVRPRPRESFFFYCDDYYFQGVLIRLKAVDQLNIRIKVYIRSNHQIVTFAKAINGKYPERCSIEVMKSKEINFQVCNLISKRNADDVS